MANRFTPSAEGALRGAQSIAESMGHTYIGSEHILMGILSERTSAAGKLLSSHGITADKVRELITELEGTGKKCKLSPRDMSPRAKRIIENAAHTATRESGGIIGTEHMLSAMLNEPQSAALKLIKAQNVSASEIYADLICLENGMTPSYRREGGRGGAKKLPASLLKYGRDLTESAEKGELDPVIGREEQTECLIRVLLRRSKNNPCLVGEPGVGKTAIVEGLAIRMAEGDVPSELLSKRIITLDLPLMLAGAKYRGDFEERVKGVIDEVSKDPDIILFIDEIHSIVGAGGSEGSIDAANMIKPALARGVLRVIGATTYGEYRKYIEKDAALERRLQPISVPEPDPETAVKMLLGLKERYERHHGIKISQGAVRAAVQLSLRYVPERFLPDKAIDLIDEASSEKRKNKRQKKQKSREDELGELLASGRLDEALLLEKESISDAKKRRDVLSPEDVESVLSRRLGIPIKKDIAKTLSTLEDRLGQRVFGQDEAIKKVASVVRRSQLGFGSEGGAMGSLLFLGNSGVGRSALCRAVAKEVFGSESALIRLDMSEYSEKHSISRLIGSPPGYVGYGEEGILSKRLRGTHRAVILFDGIDKAHPDIMSLIVSILDEGHFTDSSGKKCDLRECLIVLSADRQSEESRNIGFSLDKSLSGVKGEAEKQFTAELLSRLDATVSFKPLSCEAYCRIAKKAIDELCENAKRFGINIVYCDDILRLAAERGETSKYGARAVLKFVKDELEELIISYGLEQSEGRDGELCLFERDGMAALSSVAKNEVLHIM